MTMQATEAKKASIVLKALGNFYRLGIVMQLLDGERNVSALNEEISVSQPALSQHLAKLRREGIVSARRQQRQIFYYLNNPSFIRRILGVIQEMTTPALEKRKSA